MRGHESEVRARRVDDARFVHDVFMPQTAVCKDDLFHAVLLNELNQFLLGVDGDSARVLRTS